MWHLCSTWTHESCSGAYIETKLEKGGAAFWDSQNNDMGRGEEVQPTESGITAR